MYRIERKFGVFSKLDACTFVVNVYDEGKILSIVTDCSPHGTHVAGIATAFHPKVPSDKFFLCLAIHCIFSFLFIQ
jgi:tripeptidyl-peptidase-2